MDENLLIGSDTYQAGFEVLNRKIRDCIDFAEWLGKEARECGETPLASQLEYMDKLITELEKARETAIEGSI